MLFAKMTVDNEILVDDETRSAERRNLAEQTTMRLRDTPWNVGVFNLSATGCLIRSEIALEPGQDVRIGLPGVGAFLATVVRTDGLEAGCQFHRPLSHSQLETAFQRDVVVDGHWTPEPSGAAAIDLGDPLSPRAKLVTIVGLSAALWAVIGTGLSFVL